MKTQLGPKRRFVKVASFAGSFQFVVHVPLHGSKQTLPPNLTSLPWKDMLIKSLQLSTRTITSKFSLLQQRTLTTTSRTMAEQLRIGYVPGKLTSSLRL